jgi:glutathione peroxidase
MATIFDFTAARIDGTPFDLAALQGKVVLVVNTASACGFTPQFAGLEKLHQDYAARGLVLIGFPCNQFGGQDAGSNSEIASFCQKNYGVSFAMMEKVEVNGAGAYPLFKWLTSNARGILGTESIKWNFTKFLVGKDGMPIKRFGSADAPDSLRGTIDKALAA